jgi:hypothetical protein
MAQEHQVDYEDFGMAVQDPFWKTAAPPMSLELGKERLQDVNRITYGSANHQAPFGERF